MPRITKNKQKTNRKQKKETVSFIVVKKTRKTRKIQKGGTKELTQAILTYLNDQKRVKTTRNLWVITKNPKPEEQDMIKKIKDNIDTAKNEDVKDSKGRVYTVYTGRMKKNLIDKIQKEVNGNNDIENINYHDFLPDFAPEQADMENFIKNGQKIRNVLGEIDNLKTIAKVNEWVTNNAKAVKKADILKAANDKRIEIANTGLGNQTNPTEVNTWETTNGPFDNNNDPGNIIRNTIIERRIEFALVAIAGITTTAADVTNWVNGNAWINDQNDPRHEIRVAAAIRRFDLHQPVMANDGDVDAWMADNANGGPFVDNNDPRHEIRDHALLKKWELANPAGMNAPADVDHWTGGAGALLITDAADRNHTLRVEVAVRRFQLVVLHPPGINTAADVAIWRAANGPLITDIADPKHKLRNTVSMKSLDLYVQNNGNNKAAVDTWIADAANGGPFTDDVNDPGKLRDLIAVYRDPLADGGGKRKSKKTNKVRKHRGIVQTGGSVGRLRKGYKYTGRRLKNGQAEIKKVKQTRK